MPKITKIVPQKLGKRVNVYVDGEYSFALDLENLIKHKLKAGTELTNDQVAELGSRGELAKISENIIRFASLRPRSEWEIEHWLAKKKVAEDLWQPLKEKLIRIDLLDDEKFSRWWVESRKRFRPKPMKIIAMELSQKRVSRDVIEKVLQDEPVDEYAAALAELTRRSYKWAREEGQAKRKKMTEFLMRKGYSWNVVKTAVNEALEG